MVSNKIATPTSSLMGHSHSCTHAITNLNTSAQACTHAEGNATLFTIDIPATRPRDLTGDTEERAAQKAKLDPSNGAGRTQEAQRAKVNNLGSSEVTSTMSATGAGRRPTTQRVPARLIATRAVDIPRACWGKAQEGGFEVEFWQV